MMKGEKPSAWIWAITMCGLTTYLAAAGPQASWFAARALGIGIFFCLAIPLVYIVRRPERLARPITVFSIGCIYFFALDMAVFREVEDYPAHVILVAELVVALFLVAVLSTFSFSRVSARRWQSALARMDGNLSAGNYFWLAVFAFGLEYLRRLYLDGFSLSDLWHDLFLSRSGGAFRGGYLGDSTVWMKPAEVLFLFVPFFADRAWKWRIGSLGKSLLVPVVALCLMTLVVDGNRGYVLIAILLPLLVRAVQRDRAVGKAIALLVAASFFLAPVFDAMAQVRYSGWENLWKAHDVSWTMVSAERDDNFHYVVNLVDILENGDGVLEHQGPLGFVRGSAKFGWLALINPIPRALWPSKPSPFDLAADGRNWWDTGSVVADLLDQGGITFVIFGGICLGLWLSLLDSLYEVRKEDGAALVYSMLLAITLSMIRGAYPWNTVPLVLETVGLVLVWRALKALALARPPDAQHQISLKPGTEILAADA
jgi:hypothetical protein